MRARRHPRALPRRAARAELPAGTYEAKVALNESWTENYGAGGARDGSNIAFTVPAACAEVTFGYDSSSHVLAIAVGGEKPGNLALARAHWVTPDTIAWNAGAPGADTVFRLHSHPTGGLELSDGGVSGGTSARASRTSPATRR